MARARTDRDPRRTDAGRRRVLAATGSLLAAGLAGCGGAGEPATTTSTTTEAGLDDYRTRVSVTGLGVGIHGWGVHPQGLTSEVHVEGELFYEPRSDTPERIHVRRITVEFLDGEGNVREETVVTNDGEGWTLTRDPDVEDGNEAEWSVWTETAEAAVLRTFVVRVAESDVEAL